MAKKKYTDASAKQATVLRIKRTEACAEKVRQLFAKTVNDILALNKTMPTLDDGEMFSFDSQSIKKQQQVEQLLRRLRSSATMAIQMGCNIEWEEANKECDKLLSTCFGKQALSNPTFTAYTQRNDAARNAFIQRVEKGLKLSDKVWKSVQQLREEMEIAMTVSIGEGESASSMSRKVRQYLNDPDLMFKRFRYKKGEKIVEVTDPETGETTQKKEIIWGKKWKKRIKDPKTGKYKFIDYDKDSYKTGAGVYKSSAKNAMRVARTETNIAYRRADNERWSQMDFVLGQRVQLSKSHPKRDICDKLQGDYPKDFVFDGWHPQCFCFVTPILIDESEMIKMNEAFLEGKTYTPKGKQITDYPQNFKDWVSEHKDDIAAARERGTEPYFIRNNAKAIDDIIDPKPQKEKPLTTLEKAKLRHEQRTQEQIDDIKKRAAERQAQHQKIKDDANAVFSEAQEYGGDIDFSEIQTLIKENNLTKLPNATAMLQQKIEEQKKQEAALGDVLYNVHKWHGQYTLSELQSAQQAVKHTIGANMTKDITKMSKSELIALKDKLTYEADWKKKHPKYKTDAVVEEAYRSKLKEVEHEIQWGEINRRHTEYVTKYSATFPTLTNELTSAVQAKDFNAANAAITRLQQWDNVISKRSQYASILGAGNRGLLTDVDAAINKKNIASATNELSKLNRWEKVLQSLSVAKAAKQTAKLKKKIDELQQCIAERNIIKAESVANEIQKLTMSALEAYCQQHYTEKFTVNSQKSYDEVMQNFGKVTKPVWDNASEDEKRSFVDYCGSHSRSMLTDMAKGRKNVRVERMDKIMSQIKYPHDIVLRSGQDYEMAEHIFSKDFKNLLQAGDVDALNKRFAGTVGKNTACMSTSFNEQGGFTKQFEFHFFCPKGTPMMNVYPLSPFGGGQRTSWDGVSYGKTWRADGETEILLGRNLLYKFIRAEAGAGKGRTTRIYIQIIGEAK